ncbi:hypothetical protein DBV15_12547 [Temnothorax longispinosus]|uniref:Uncharacterized protein n=1 Tax=Temnothorax longispinosus TaxID=300112 RepID=A0A4S2JLN0_9HYME|nr:hypothetical protein DBV15_12547 [Temnothorax longispinosus]
MLLWQGPNNHPYGFVIDLHDYKNDIIKELGRSSAACLVHSERPDGHYYTIDGYKASVDAETICPVAADDTWEHHQVMNQIDTTQSSNSTNAAVAARESCPNTNC